MGKFISTLTQVVDGPGVGDTRMDTKDSVDLVVSRMEQAMLLNPLGYHAFLQVVRYGGRFTQEDKDTVAFLKKLFGSDFVRRFCILVMTCGDSFERESEDSGLTFEQWCHQQGGVFRELLQECGQRIVLFDNLTKDKAKQDAQIDKLLETISGLQARGHRYTDDNFKRAAAMREKALVESKKSLISEEILQEVSLILQKLNEEKIDFQHDKPITPLQKLSARCEALINSVHEQDKGTRALHDLEEKVKSVKKSVDDAILVHTTATEERKKMEEKEKTMIKQMDDEMKIRKQQMNQIQEQMSENIEKQRQHYQRMMDQSELNREKMQEEFERRRAEIENDSRTRLQAAQADLDDQRRRNDQQLALERSNQAEQTQQMLALAHTQMQTQAQNLHAAYRETKKTSAAGVMIKGLGCVAFVAGCIIAPEVMTVLWMGASLYAASENN